jgi:hypothetical protein
MRLSAMAAGLAFLTVTPVLAETGEGAIADTLACQAVRGTKARLRCFDAALPALQSAFPEAVTLAHERAEAARAVAAEQATEEFGLAKRDDQKATNEFEKAAFGASDLPASEAGDDDDEVKSVDGKAVEVGKNNVGKLFVVLDNGQVWRQVSGDRSTPYIPKNASGLPVTVTKGLMGSYFIKVGKAKDAFKAERIK